MLNITFKGQPFIMVTDSVIEGGAIATFEDYKAGNQSFAHLFPDGNVRQHGKVIGTRADVEVLGKLEEPKMSQADSLAALHNMLGWMGGLR